MYFEYYKKQQGKISSSSLLFVSTDLTAILPFSAGSFFFISFAVVLVPIIDSTRVPWPIRNIATATNQSFKQTKNAS